MEYELENIKVQDCEFISESELKITLIYGSSKMKSAGKKSS